MASEDAKAVGEDALQAKYLDFCRFGDKSNPGELESRQVCPCPLFQRFQLTCSLPQFVKMLRDCGVLNANSMFYFSFQYYVHILCVHSDSD